MEAFNPSTESTTLTNGHALSDALNQIHGDQKNERYVFILSGKDEKAVRSASTNLGIYLSSKGRQLASTHMKNLAYTLGQRRSRFPWVAATSAQNISELIEILDSKQFKPSHSNKKPRLGFVFNGQGAQWHAMGRELISAYPVFQASVQEADQCIKDFGARWSLTGKPLHSIICVFFSVSSTIFHYVEQWIAHLALVVSFRVFNLLRMLLQCSFQFHTSTELAIGRMFPQSAERASRSRKNPAAKTSLFSASNLYNLTREISVMSKVTFYWQHSVSSIHALFIVLLFFFFVFCFLRMQATRSNTCTDAEQQKNCCATPKRPALTNQ